VCCCRRFVRHSWRCRTVTVVNIWCSKATNVKCVPRATTSVVQTNAAQSDVLLGWMLTTAFLTENLSDTEKLSDSMCTLSQQEFDHLTPSLTQTALYSISHQKSFFVIYCLPFCILFSLLIAFYIQCQMWLLMWLRSQKLLRSPQKRVRWKHKCYSKI